ncbi:hypothetical protein Hte_004727 [Hypoxylon texense]
MPTVHHCPLGSKGGCRKKGSLCVQHQVLCSKHHKSTIKGQECGSCRAEREAETRKRREQRKKEEEKKDEEKKQQAWNQSYGSSKSKDKPKNKK